MSEQNAVVGIVMGSSTDEPVMQKAAGMLDDFEVGYTMEVISAHRQPAKVSEWATSARERGYKVLIAGAGRAAHLPGVVAAHTTLPVIGVPCLSDHLGGADALYSIVQMPSGVPVATVGIDNGKNAGLLAVQMLALADDALAQRLEEFKRDQAEGRERKKPVGFTG